MGPTVPVGTPSPPCAFILLHTARGIYLIAGGSARTGSYNRFLNVQVFILISLQLSLCAICAGVALWWRQHHGYQRYFLALQIHDQAHAAVSRA